MKPERSLGSAQGLAAGQSASQMRSTVSSGEPHYHARARSRAPHFHARAIALGPEPPIFHFAAAAQVIPTYIWGYSIPPPRGGGEGAGGRGVCS